MQETSLPSLVNAFVQARAACSLRVRAGRIAPGDQKVQLVHRQS